MADEKVRQQIHVSGIQMLNDCGIKFMYRYLMGMKRPPNAFLLVGKACDESITYDLNNKIEKGELLDRKDVIGIAEAKFDSEQAAEPVELDPDEKREGRSLEQVIGEAKDKTVSLAGLHHDEAAPLIRPHATRRKFSIDMDGFLRMRAKELHAEADKATNKQSAKILHAQAANMNVAARDGCDYVGEIDIVERYVPDVDLLVPEPPDKANEILVVRDSKTSAKSPTKSLLDGSDTPGIADDSEQLTAYATATQVLDGKLPDEMVLDYLIRTNAKTPTVKYVPTKTRRTMEDITVFLNRFANAVQVIRSGMFVPANPTAWQCSQKWCGFWEICEYSKKPKLIQIK